MLPVLAVERVTIDLAPYLLCVLPMRILGTPVTWPFQVWLGRN